MRTRLRLFTERRPHALEAHPARVVIAGDVLPSAMMITDRISVQGVTWISCNLPIAAQSGRAINRRRYENKN